MASVNEPYVPVAPSPSKCTWSDMEIDQTISLKAGYSNKAYQAVSRDMGDEGQPDRYVKITKCEDWLLKAVGGPLTQRGALKRVTVVDELRTKMLANTNTAECAEPAPPVNSAVAEAPAEAAAEAADPMLALDDVASEATTTPNKKPRKSRAPKRLREQVVKVTMPLHCPCAQPDSETTIEISLLATSTNTLWISLNDIPWLVRYVADEYGLGGIAIDKQAETAVAVANCSVPYLSVRWDFKGEPGWNAIFVDGPQGGRIFLCDWHL